VIFNDTPVVSRLLAEPEVSLLGCAGEDDVGEPLNFTTRSGHRCVVLESGGSVRFTASNGYETVLSEPAVTAELADIGQVSLELIRAGSKCRGVVAKVCIEGPTQTRQAVLRARVRSAIKLELELRQEAFDLAFVPGIFWREQEVKVDALVAIGPDV
jgi:hypothetical protein